MNISYKVYFSKVSLFFCLILLLSQIGVLPGRASSLAATYYVAPPPVGGNTADCGTMDKPCATIQFVVNKALSGDTILVAAGVYSTPPDNPDPVCFAAAAASKKSIFCIVNKHLTIRGGYSTSNWSVSDPLANPTIIDGQDLYRGVTLLGSSNTTSMASLTLENFVIRNGYALGASIGVDYALTGAGGGMYIDKATFSLRNITFSNSRAQGGTTTQSFGGKGVGGGLWISDMPAGATGTMENLTFTDNVARGGIGRDRGGLALGGGFFIWRGRVNATDLTVRDNLAQAGHTTGIGRDLSSMPAEAAGGGFSIHEGSAEFSQILVRDNSAIGGNGTVYSGGGYGGGIELESDTYLRITDSVVRNNHAIGGNAQNGAMAGGGGFLWDRTTIIIDRVQVIGNTVKGGTGTTKRGSAVGGGIHAFRSSGTATISILNSIIANNLVELGDGTGPYTVGAGGGMLIQSYPAVIEHTTISGNRLSPELVYGAALAIKTLGDIIPIPPPSNVTLNYSLITEHVNSNPVETQSTLHAWSGSVFNLYRGLFAGNTLDTNIEGSPYSDGGPGIFNGIATMLHSSSAGYIASGDPYYNYHLRSDSPAKDQATGSSFTVDFETNSRPFATFADIGADEYHPFTLTINPIMTGALYLDWSSNAPESSSMLNGVHHYAVIVICPAGANPPDQGSCGTPISAGTGTHIILTGLSSEKLYSFIVQAMDSSETVLASSVEVQGAPPPSSIFLPLTLH